MRERAYAQEFWLETGRMLRTARKAKGINLASVGGHLGLAHQNVLQAEKGMCRIPLDRLIRWCLFVGVDPADLVTQLLEKHPELRERKVRET